MKSDETLHDQQLSGQFVANNVSAMLAYWDKDLICRFANDAYLFWFGKSPDEMVDKMKLDELLGEELFKKNLPFITAALDGEVQTFEREIDTPLGGKRHSIANYFPDIMDGIVRGFFVHVADINPVKMLELKQLRSNEITSAQNNRLLNFAGIVSHNLQSYSNNLSTIVNLLTSAETETERKELLVFLKGISKEFSSTVQHLNEIVEVQNVGNVKAERINLHEYINKAIDALGIQIRFSNADIQNNVDTDFVFSANPAYIESIILNLLTNAIKYRQPDRKPVIKFDILMRKKNFALRIEDNGRGINLKKHGDDLFGMYKTFHGNNDARGIGLFITKFQIENMGGWIEVESDENKGTVFSVYFKLPVNEQDNI